MRVIASAIVLLAAVMLAIPPSTAAPVPGTTCDVFPSDNVWNMDVSGLPVHPKSAIWKRSSHAGSTLLHPDFGGSPYGFPFAVTDSSTSTTSVHFTYASESDPGPYPVTASTPIEQGSDRHALMIDQDSCTLYELFGAQWNHGNPRAGSGAIFDPARMPFDRPAGRAPMRPDFRSSPDSSAMTRSRLERSTTRSGSRSRAPATGTCGRLDTRQGFGTGAARRWARGSD